MVESDSEPADSDAWKDETKAIERVIQIAQTLSRPRTADWIAKEAMVAEQTARDHMGVLSDLGVVIETTDRGATKYQLDAAYLWFKEVSRYVAEFDKDGLMDLVEDKQEAIADVRDRYGVDSPDELRAKATADSVSPDEVREYKKVAAEWETLRDERDAIKEAIERYDEFSRDVRRQ